MVLVLVTATIQVLLWRDRRIAAKAKRHPLPTLQSDPDILDVQSGSTEGKHGRTRNLGSESIPQTGNGSSV